MYVPHEVQNQRALAKRTSQIIKNRQDVNIQMSSSNGSGTSNHGYITLSYSMK